MSRLIDADALKKYATGGVTSVGLLTLAEIDAAPTIDAVPVVWRKVPDDLPEVGADVLMYYNPGYMTVGWLDDVEDNDTQWRVLCDSGWYTDCDNPPDYWMELPHKPTERLEVDGDG